MIEMLELHYKNVNVSIIKCFSEHYKYNQYKWKSIKSPQETEDIKEYQMKILELKNKIAETKS